MAITATVGGGSASTSVSVGGNNVEVVKVTVPGVQGETGAAGAASSELNTLSDVDSTSVADGSVMMYDASASKWVATNLIAPTSGTLIFNAGVL